MAGMRHHGSSGYEKQIIHYRIIPPVLSCSVKAEAVSKQYTYF